MAQKLPDYALFLKQDEDGYLLLRKVGGEGMGIVIKQNFGGWSPSATTEAFIIKKDAIEIIAALKKYFKIEE